MGKLKDNGKAIFCIFAFLMAVLITVAVYLARDERQRHEANFDRYVLAGELMDMRMYGQALAVYLELIGEYPNSFALEYMAALSEFSMGNYAAALPRALRAMELFPILGGDAEFLLFLEEIFEFSGDLENAAAVRERRLSLG